MTRQVDVQVTPEVVERARQVAFDLQRSIGLSEPWTSLNAYLDPQARLGQIAAAERTLAVDFRGRKILELGSGMGMLVVVARKIGLDLIGSEPAANSYKSLRAATEALLRANDVSLDSIDRSSGEGLPWADGTFDVVLSYQVLEHVRDPRLTLREAMRVLKPGGRLYFDMPNYHSLIEGHYGIAWLPILAHSKTLARSYVRLAGRNPDFLDEINMVTPGRLRTWIRPLGEGFAVRSEPCADGNSPSTQDITVVTNCPELPVGERYTGVARHVRSTFRRGRVKSALRRIGITEHIVLEGRK